MQAEVSDWLRRRTSSGEDWDRDELVHQVPLIDELVVTDSGSTDETASVAVP